MSTQENGILLSLTDKPWWYSVICAIAVYFFIKFFPPLIHTDNVFIDGFLKLSPVFASMLAFLMLIPAIISLVNSLERRWIVNRYNSLDKVLKLSTRDFREWLHANFKLDGYQVSRIYGHDNLCDLIIKKDGKKQLVHCGNWKRENTSFELVQDVFIESQESYALGCKIITTGVFDSNVHSYAKNKSIDLVEGNQFYELFFDYENNIDKENSSIVSQISELANNISIPIGQDTLRPDQKAKIDTQALADDFWGTPEFKHLNISRMAEEVHKHEPANYYSYSTVRKWVRDIAPKEKKGKRGRPKKIGV